jgi:hypothetical protein
VVPVGADVVAPVAASVQLTSQVAPKLCFFLSATKLTIMLPAVEILGLCFFFFLLL